MSYYNETAGYGSWGAGTDRDPWRIARLKEEAKKKKAEEEAIEWVRTDMAFTSPELYSMKANRAIERFPEHADILIKWFLENYPELRQPEEL
jgi:hypothetical protein